MRSTSACGGSHLVAQPVSGGLHSFLEAGAQRGANAALAGTGHGFSEMHALSIFGVRVWALNIEQKSAVRLCKTWQDNNNQRKTKPLFIVFLPCFLHRVLATERPTTKTPKICVPVVPFVFPVFFFFFPFLA